MLENEIANMDIMLVSLVAALFITVATCAAATCFTLLWLTSEKRNRG